MRDSLENDDGPAPSPMNIRTMKTAINLLAILGLISMMPGTRADEELQAGGPAALIQPPPEQPRLGMNFNGLADWNTELPFVDVFREARAWVSQQEGAAWGKGPALDLDGRGWIRSLEEGAYACTPLLTISDGHIPEGIYTVLYDGEGEITFSGAAVQESGPGRITLLVGQERGFFLEIRRTNPQNYIRNVRVIRPGFENNYAQQVFDPRFLERWKGVACIRFLGWMDTNGSTLSKWPDRPKMDDAIWTQKGKGPPVEVMIDLCNRQMADAWFLMPHLADDDFVENFARLVKERLDPRLRVYVEYSNEVWNGSFEQHHHAAAKGKELGLGDPAKPWEGAGMYHVRRSIEIMKIWERVFGGTDRLVRVLAWQAGGPWWLDNILLTSDEQNASFDAYAIAPYLALMPTATSAPSSAEVTGWTVDQVLDHLDLVVLPEVANNLRPTAEAAARHGLALIAYEGGQHLVANGVENRNAKLVELLRSANGHPRMGEIYRKYYAAWQEAGGGLFCPWLSTGDWTIWGSWGLLRYADQKPDDVAKCRATLDWATSLGQRVGTGE